MSDYLPVISKKLRLYFSPIVDDWKARRDKTFFWPCGTQVYCGRQGSGKTISAVYHVYCLKNRYPAMILVSNLQLTYLTPRHFSTKGDLRRILNTAREGVDDSMSPFNAATDYIYFSTMEQLTFALVEINNDFKGVVYLIDEIHTYFNALDSKNIPMFIFTEISQQRKQRKCIIGTSQLFMRMAKPFREQCDNIIMCNTLLNILTIQHVYDGVEIDIDYDGKIIGHSKRFGFFFHSRKIRNSFDTYQKVISANEQYQQLLKPVPPLKM